MGLGGLHSQDLGVHRDDPLTAGRNRLIGGSVRSIMVVEDHEEVRAMICDILAQEGLHVIQCRDGQAALMALATASPLPCLIFLDLSMPVMNGFEFRRRQLLEPTLCTIPVVVVSAHHDLDGQKEELRADAYLLKPVRLKELLALARKYAAEP